MVRTRKKVAKKDERATAKVTFVEEEPLPQTLPITVDEPKSVDYKKLVEESPAVPNLSNMEDTVKFVDEYARWKRKIPS